MKPCSGIRNRAFQLARSALSLKPGRDVRVLPALAFARTGDLKGAGAGTAGFTCVVSPTARFTVQTALLRDAVSGFCSSPRTSWPSLKIDFAQSGSTGRPDWKRRSLRLFNCGALCDIPAPCPTGMGVECSPEQTVRRCARKMRSGANCAQNSMRIGKLFTIRTEGMRISARSSPRFAAPT
jgi:hypothetical protein